MKIISVLLFLSASFRPCYSQNKYTKFIERSAVSWAIDGTDTLRFLSPNLSLLLREKLNAEKIKVAIAEPGTSTVTSIRVVKKSDIVKVIAPNMTIQTMDADGNITGTIVEAEAPLLSSKYFDEQTMNLVETVQIFYMESGRLKSYIPWVSTKYAITTSWGERLGMANAFSTSFRKCRGFASRSKKKAIRLGTQTRIIHLDTNGTGKPLKQLYGQNLVQALWPQLSKKYYELMLPGSNERIQLSQINQTLIEESPVAVPVYDEEGNLTPNELILQERQPLDLSAITRVDIVQDWYYYDRKNQVHSTVKEVVLYAIRSKRGVPASTASPVLRILVK